MKLAKGASAIFDRVIDFMGNFASFLIVAATVIIATDVVLRKYFNSPLIWATETSGYLVAWLVFLSAAWILRRNAHVTVDFVVGALKPRAQIWLGIVSSLIGAIVCLLLTIYGTQLVWGHFQQNIQFSTLLQPPKAPLIGIIPLSTLILSIQFVRRGCNLVRQLPESKGGK